MSDTAIIVASVLGLLAALLLVAAFVLRFRAEVEARLRATDRRLTAIMLHLGVPEPEHADVVALARGGRRVEATKLYRRHTAADLVEATRAVDEMARRTG